MLVAVGQGGLWDRLPGVTRLGRWSQSVNVSSRQYWQTQERHTFLRPPGPPVLTRLRLLMTSVFREMGRGRPCSFKKRPQALHSTEPDSSRRQSGVVLVVQFWQTGCSAVSSELARWTNGGRSAIDCRLLR